MQELDRTVALFPTREPPKDDSLSIPDRCEEARPKHRVNRSLLVDMRPGAAEELEILEKRYEGLRRSKQEL